MFKKVSSKFSLFFNKILFILSYCICCKVTLFQVWFDFKRSKDKGYNFRGVYKIHVGIAKKYI